MALKGWTLPTSTFPLPGDGEIAVRGLSVDQIAALVREDKDTLTRLFERVMDRKDVAALAEKIDAGEETPEVDVAELGLQDVAVDLLNAAPRLVAKVIAWSAQEPDAIEEALTIPFPTQLEILVEIGRLTFEKTSPGKFMETVVALMQSANVGVAAAQAVRKR